MPIVEAVFPPRFGMPAFRDVVIASLGHPALGAAERLGLVPLALQR